MIQTLCRFFPSAMHYAVFLVENAANEKRLIINKMKEDTYE
jgi:hypothetical protein